MRRLFLIVVAAVSLGAAKPPEGSGHSNNSSSARPAPMRVAITNFPASKDSGCNAGEQKRESDLCAQWEAADAARQAAKYSWWAVMLSGLGTAFLLGSLIQAWRTSRAELRAYLFPESGNIFGGTHHEIPEEAVSVPGVIIAIKNFGHIYIHSSVSYVDIFGQPRRTEFCQSIKFRGSPMQRNATFDLQTIGPFNGMDEGCRYPPQRPKGRLHLAALAIRRAFSKKLGASAT